jgi:hypothetical protein
MMMMMVLPVVVVSGQALLIPIKPSLPRLGSKRSLQWPG